MAGWWEVYYQHLVSMRKYTGKYINTLRAHIHCTIRQLYTLFSIMYSCLYYNFEFNKGVGIITESKKASM